VKTLGTAKILLHCLPVLTVGFTTDHSYRQSAMTANHWKTDKFGKSFSQARPLDRANIRSSR
jgi:hypothetical protein